MITICKECITAIKEVFSEKKYYALSVGFAVLVFASNSLLLNYKLLLSSFSLSLAWSLFVGFPSLISKIGLSFLLLIAILSGIVISMSVFLVRRQIKGGYSAGSTGLIAGLLTPACPSCALSVLGVLGLGGFLSVLPFKGLELGILGILVLVGSIGYLSKKIVTKVCELPTKKTRKKTRKRKK